MKYIVKYTRNNRQISTTRFSDSAEAAIEKLCDQYGWRGKLKQYDADTRGKHWAEVIADPEGGINYSLRIVAVKAE